MLTRHGNTQSSAQSTGTTLLVSNFTQQQYSPRHPVALIDWLLRLTAKPERHPSPHYAKRKQAIPPKTTCQHQQHNPHIPSNTLTKPLDRHSRVFEEPQIAVRPPSDHSPIHRLGQMDVPCCFSLMTFLHVFNVDA